MRAGVRIQACLEWVALRANVWVWRVLPIWFGITAVALSGCGADLQDLEQSVAEFRHQAEVLSPSAAIASIEPLRLPERVPQSPFYDRFHAELSPGSAFVPIVRSRFASDSDVCAPTALEFRGWIRDTGRMRAWIACPGEPIRAVARGETLDTNGAWVASISPDELLLYPGADSRSGASMLVVVPFQGRAMP
jgi:hypothetical protein